MARLAKPIDLEQLTKLMRWKPTKADVAAFFACSEDTIDRRIRDLTKSDERPDGLSFKEFREVGLSDVKERLINTAIDRALDKSDTMLIFCLKNLCNWTDKQQIDAAVIGGSLEQRPQEDIEARFEALKQKLLSLPSGESEIK